MKVSAPVLGSQVYDVLMKISDATEVISASWRPTITLNPTVNHSCSKTSLIFQI
jgi:hypothetical protein